MMKTKDIPASAELQSVNRWRIATDGGLESDRELLARGKAHSDHLEMSGRAVNAIIQWQIDESGRMSVGRWVRWPMVREIKDDTHAAFGNTFHCSALEFPTIDNTPYTPAPAHRFWIHGCLSWEERGCDLTIRRTIFPSTSLACLLEQWEIHNTGSQPLPVRIPSSPINEPQPRENFKWGLHIVRTEWIGSGLRMLGPGEGMTAGIVFSCRGENAPVLYPDLAAEWAARAAFRDSLYSKLALTTPDPVLNELFAFSKLHAAENVLATRGGLMHAPGGFNRYLAAIWCNDQNEYINPFFPFLGDAAGNESAINSFRWFAKYQNSEFRPIPSSVCAEGRDVWSGAGDRGDAAMTASGAARWALTTGDEIQAREIWPFIRWCLEYCERQKDEQGVIASDSDEFENRFSAGRTNLATSCLTYDALISSAYLALALGEPAEMADQYRKSAAELRQAIDNHFGATIAGYQTYRYHEKLEQLRSWICYPLTVGIHERAVGTVAALFGDALWTSEGLLTEENTNDYWDRNTLYALRGVFQAGFADEGFERLAAFSRRRLLGDHVPYCLEAFPESNQSQCSAESGLFCRIFIEGICGLRPIGFHVFECTPHLPTTWPDLSLVNIHAFARQWDITLKRKEFGIEAAVTLGGGTPVYRATLPEGATHTISFDS